MATTYSSRKAKGSRLERDIASAYRSSGLFPKAQRMPMSGAMQFHKGDIFKGETDEYVEECKNQEKVQLWKWWEQAKDQCTGLEKPMLHVSRNYSEILTVMRFDDVVQMRLELRDLRKIVEGNNGNKS